jgi:hypothetical protein
MALVDEFLYRTELAGQNWPKLAKSQNPSITQA